MNTYNSDEWQGWMHAALNGDAGAYRKLLAAARPWLLSYYRRRLRGGDCEDLVQMTLLSLHEKRHTYDVTAPFMPWIAAIARNKLIDYVRKAGRHVHVELDEAMGIDDGLRPDLAARDVKVLLGHLPKDQARVISLHKLNELSVEETAAATGKSPSAVKVIVHRGLKKLQSLVGVKGGADE
jgi:RNA polymerase sigma-70 factor, ECF subfamily